MREIEVKGVKIKFEEDVEVVVKGEEITIRVKSPEFVPGTFPIYPTYPTCPPEPWKPWQPTWINTRPLPNTTPYQPTVTC